MREERCDTCRWYDLEGNEGEDHGQCRRRSPVLVLRMVVLREELDRNGDHAAWPFTFRHDWCGDWQAQETAPE